MSQFLSILYAFICFACLIYLKKRFIIVVPLLNLIGDSLLAATQASGFFHSGNIRAIILILYISYYFFYFRIKLNKTDFYVFLFMVYLACVVIINYNYINIALTTSLKIFIIFSLFIIAHHCITDISILKSLNKYVLISLILSFFSLLLFQYFKYGESQYLAETFYEGGGGAPTVYIGFSLLVFPLYLRFNKKFPRILVPIIYTAGIIFIMLSVKRLSIISFFAGLLIQLFLFKRKIRIIPVVLLISLLILLASPLYVNVLRERFEYRLEATHISEEGRVKETYLLINEFSENNVANWLTGFGFDNGRRFYETETGEYSRGFHTFYAMLLHNAGIVGFILFLLMIFRILNRFFKYHKYLKKDPDWRLIRIIALSLMIAYIIQITSFGLNYITIISLIFIYLGAFIGIAEKKIYSLAELKNNTRDNRIRDLQNLPA